MRRCILRWLALAGLTALVASQGVRDAGAAPAARSDTSGPLAAIGVIGDSVTFGTLPWIAGDLTAAGWGSVRTHAGPGVRVADDRDFHALSMVRKWRAEGFSPTHWIIGLGNNDVGFITPDPAAARVLIERMLDELGPDAHVLWPNITHQHASRQAAWNQALTEVAAARPNLQIFDWEAVVAAHPGWVGSDGVHASPTAYRERSLMLTADSLRLVPAQRVPGAAPVSTAPAGEPAAFLPLDPQRVVDTRAGQGGTRLAAGATLRVDNSALVPAGSTAAAVNLTVDGANAPGYLTAWNCVGAPPSTSALNYDEGQPRGAHTIVSLDGQAGFCVTSLAATDVIVDVFGAFTPQTEAGRLAPMAPLRLLDTRDSARPSAGTELRVTVPEHANEAPGAVAVNLTSTEPGGAGYLTAYPCGGTRPVVSNVNFRGPGDVANLALVKVGEGSQLCIFASAPSHVVVDLLGVFGSVGSRYQAAAPVRLLDTRDGTGGWMGYGFDIAPVDIDATTIAGVPADASALSLTVAAAGAQEPGFVTTWPCGQTPPTASTVNVTGANAVANAAIVALADGRTCLGSFEPATLIVDLTGWFMP